MANRTSQHEQVRFDVTPHRWSEFPASSQAEAVVLLVRAFPIAEVRCTRRELVVYVSVPQDVDLAAVHAKVAKACGTIEELRTCVRHDPQAAGESFEARQEDEFRESEGGKVPPGCREMWGHIGRLQRFLRLESGYKPDGIFSATETQGGVVDTAIALLRADAKLAQYVVDEPTLRAEMAKGESIVDMVIRVLKRCSKPITVVGVDLAKSAFKIGDVVCLRIGSQTMRIVGFDGNFYECSDGDLEDTKWFYGHNLVLHSI